MLPASRRVSARASSRRGLTILGLVAVAVSLASAPASWPSGAQAPVPSHLYVTEGNYFGPSQGSLIRIDPATHALQYLQPPGVEGVAVGFVTVSGVVYWGSQEPGEISGIHRANLDGSGADLLVGSPMPMGIAVDDVHRKLYWADAGRSAVFRSNLDGSGAEALITGLGCGPCYVASPMGIALDVPGGKVYWANMGAHEVQRADLDGGNVQTLATVVDWPSGIAVDPVAQKLYWAEQGGSIIRSNLDGTQAERVLADLAPYVMDLAIDPLARTMYWTSQEPGRVMKANLDGSNVETVASGLAAVAGIAVTHDQTITFAPLADKTYGDGDFGVVATASSGLTVSFAASGSCTVSGATVHLAGAGSCAVTASQAGDSTYGAAPDVTRAFSIAKAGQTIAFGPLPAKTLGAPSFRVRASASSGLPVSFAAQGRCTVHGSTVHLTGAGSCTITASQPGDANYLAAADVSQTFAIARSPCRVPRVIGERLPAARHAITQSHCRVGVVRYRYSTRRKGSIVSQRPRPGRVLPPSSAVDLAVSRGPRS